MLQANTSDNAHIGPGRIEGLPKNKDVITRNHQVIRKKISVYACSRHIYILVAERTLPTKYRFYKNESAALKQARLGCGNKNEF